MANNPIFSIVIIGFNTGQSLKNLLASINNIIFDKESLEVVYIDDGSTDSSLFMFKKYKLNFKKICFGFDKNMGRVYATDKGIRLASGEWLLFLQSNVIVDDNILNAYYRAINEDVIAVGGKIIYESDDQNFQKYLNHSTRGINGYKQYELIEYRHLLFCNSLIKRSVFHNINLNLKLQAYGGEELEFAYRLKTEYPQQIVACKTSIVTRVNHPKLIAHCLRLEEFGNFNFPLLNNILQQSIVKYKLFLKKEFIFKHLILVINKVSFGLYRLGWGSFGMIRVVMLTSILKGYYKSTK